MDNLGSEIGQKMRSAVKAKLLELGTGGSAGYIDDELPDYVMIMVANKRSKQQMISDLNLFLGTHTDLFVTWLHEVLQKLQEVTLPAVALQKKRKFVQRDETTLNKKDKKDKKKDKKIQKKTCEQESNQIVSITDVFAGDLIEQAKKTFEIDANAVHKDKKQEEALSQKDEGNNFNIPTITEMTTQPVGDLTVAREKDLVELADIQRKIYAAKKQLNILDDEDESEDEDFLNIKEDAEDEGEEFEESNNVGGEKKKKSKAKSPIVFDTNDRSIDDLQTPQIKPTTSEKPVVASSFEPVPPENFNFSNNFSSGRTTADHSQSFHKSETFHGQEHGVRNGNLRKKSIHERLGHINRDHKSDNFHPHRRVEKELYIPAFRRREMEKEKRTNDEMDSRPRSKRSSSVERKNRERDHSSEGPHHQQRIGSRVVVAPPKPDLNDEESDNQRPERPVNSIIKIKPRPSISPSKQACKNLLLRAVAEAQRSTILVKPKKDISIRKSSVTVGVKRNAKYFTKSYRDRLGRDALIRRAAKNFFIEVKADANRQNEENEMEMDQEEEEEYVPEQVSDRGESDMEHVYVPQVINYSNNEDEDFNSEETDHSINQNKTQFVVTLNDKKASNYKSKSKSSRLNGSEHSSRSDSRKSVRDKCDIRSRLELKKEQTRIDRESNSSPSCSTPPRPSSSMSSSKKSELIKIYKRPKEVKKIVIKNDSEDDDFHIPKTESQNKVLDITKLEKSEKEEKHKKEDRPKKLSSKDEKTSAIVDTEEEGSTTPPLPPRKLIETENKITPTNKRKRQLIQFDLVSKQTRPEEPVIPPKRRSNSYDESNIEDAHKISTKIIESKKYDNLPSSLNSISIDSLVTKSKPKERCKYFPTCTKDICEFYHPVAPCKSFPNCKFADKCIYVHPKCKFDLTCTKIGCNFQHSAPIGGQLSAPPLSSHVVPVQNYKTISSTATVTPSMCKFYPNCSKPGCPFIHPKMCRFGKFCNNKLDCNFYHQDVASNKFKWVASIV